MSQALAKPVEDAIADLSATFGGTKISTEPDGSGGARVLIEPLALGLPYRQSEIWMGGHLPAQLPYADVYPLFVSADLARIDAAALGEGMSTGHTFMSRLSVQVSRRSNNIDFDQQTVSMKFQKVLQWMKER